MGVFIVIQTRKNKKIKKITSDIYFALFRNYFAPLYPHKTLWFCPHWMVQFPIALWLMISVRYRLDTFEGEEEINNFYPDSIWGRLYAYWQIWNFANMCNFSATVRSMRANDTLLFFSCMPDYAFFMFLYFLEVSRVRIGTIPYLFHSGRTKTLSGLCFTAIAHSCRG